MLTTTHSIRLNYQLSNKFIRSVAFRFISIKSIHSFIHLSVPSSDTNGWCPFCERVWVAVRAKGLPYQETLVPLQGKPEWYKQMVPTGLVPAVLFHGDQAENEEETDTPSTPNTRRELVWESDAILRALDAKFPDTVRLMRDDDEDFNEALKLQDRVQAAGFKMAYANRNGTLTDAEIEEHRSVFGVVLDGFV